MVNYKVGVEFATTVGNYSRDMAQAETVTRTFGTEAASSLKTASVATDGLTLASQRVEAATGRLAAARERLNAVQASGIASTRELAAAQTAFVSSQERLLAAQTQQARLVREAQVAPHATLGHGSILGLAGGLAATELALKAKDAIEAGARSSANLAAINTQVQNTLAATGDTANTSAEHIDKVGESIARTSGIEDKAVVAGQLLALTFTGIRNQGSGANAIFDRAAQTAANLAIGLHLSHGGAVDYQAAMQQLGRALNDPIAGMTLLTRAGVSFTSSQKEQIKHLAESGQMLQAQSLILDLVNQKFADAAKSYGQGPEGQFARSKVALDEFERALAAPILQVAPPVFAGIRAGLGFLTDHPATLQLGELVVVLGGVAFAFAAVEKAVKFLKESEWLSAIGRWLFGYRTLGRTITTLAAEEEAHAAAATSAATAESANATAIARTGAAAAVATPEVAALDVAEAAGAGAAAAGGGGLLARLGLAGAGAYVTAGRLATAGTIAAGFIDPVILASLFAGGSDSTSFDKATATQASLLGGFSYRNGRYYAGNVAVTDPHTLAILQTAGTGVKGAPTTSDAAVIAANKRYPAWVVDPNSPGQQLNTVKRQTALLAATLANAAGVAVIGQGGLPNVTAQQLQGDQGSAAAAFGSLTDAPSTIHADRLAALSAADRSVQLAQARYAAAQRNVATVAGRHVDPEKLVAGQDRLTAAEDRLQAIRLKHGTTAAQVASAEAAIASARAHLNTLTGAGAGSTDRLANAELRLKGAHDSLLSAEDRRNKAQHAAGAGGALSAADVVRRFGANLPHERDLVAAEKSLAEQGVAADVIRSIRSLEQSAPGTLQRVARSLNPVLVHTLNTEFSASRRQYHDFLVIPFQAAALAAQADHARLIKDLAAADARAFAHYYQVPGLLPANVPTSRGGHPVDDNGRPIGVTLGVAPAAHSLPQVHVHVHTVQPMNVRNETNINEVNVKDPAALEHYTRRVRGRAVWN